MIQATGTIVMSDGVTSYIHPLINVNHMNSCKGRPQRLIAQVAVMRPVDSNSFATPISDILYCEYNVKNSNFEDAQLYLKEQLETAFPDVTFEVV
jgi:hypothetical protein